MHRCFIPPENWTATCIQPPAEERHHLLHVLRLTEGANVLAFDGVRREAETRLERNGPDSLYLRITRMLPPRTRPLSVSLVTAVIKGSRMDTLIEKATELGVARIQPILTTRTVVKVQDAAPKRERWRRIAVSAAKQCGTPCLPDIAPILTFDAWLQSAPLQQEPLLLAALDGNPPPIAEVAQEVLANGASRISIAIGPEGDFTPQEYAAAREAGTRFVALGPLVLRAETAALYAVSVLQALADCPHSCE